MQHFQLVLKDTPLSSGSTALKKACAKQCATSIKHCAQKCATSNNCQTETLTRDAASINAVDMLHVFPQWTRPKKRFQRWSWFTWRLWSRYLHTADVDPNPHQPEPAPWLAFFHDAVTCSFIKKLNLFGVQTFVVYVRKNSNSDRSPGGSAASWSA